MQIISKHNASYVRTIYNDGSAREVYLSGIPSGDFTDRPDAAILGPNDAGLPYCATDTDELWKWSGSAWELIMSGGGGVTLPIAESDVTGLVSDLAGKAAASHTHAESEVTGLIADLSTLASGISAKVTANGAITGATKTKITYDSKGLVTAGADATTADIADSTNKRYVTDAQQTVIGNTSGTNSGDVTLAGTPNYLTIVGQVITRALIDLASHITGRLPFANLVAATAASRLIGRRSGSSGDFEEVTLSGLSMSSGAVLSADLTGSSTTTFTNKRFTARVGTTASSSTPTPDADANDEYTVTALAAAATFGAPTGTPTEGQYLLLRVKDDGTARTLAWNGIYRASGDLALPTTTVISKTMYMLFCYNATDSKWDLLASLGNF